MRKFLQAVVVGSVALVMEAQEAAPKAEVPARTAPSSTVEQQRQGHNRREAPAAAAPAAGDTRKKSSPQQPLISFIDSPSATCYQPDPLRDACYVNWYYSSVDANPNYMIEMVFTLNGIQVARTSGFFQTSMYVPYNMFGLGFRLPCGSLGAGGNPDEGNAYAWTIKAKDSANLGSANYGTVYCPAYIPSP